MKNVSEDEVLVEIMRRILKADSYDMYIDIQTGTASGAFIIDGMVNISLDEAETLKRARG
jgi:hypothetical protein